MELLDGNRLTLLESGAAFFPALEAAIASARHEVYLETYIFADDATGRRIARALAEAAAQGVRTNVLVDGMTVKRYSRGIRDQLLAANVSLGIYRPDISPWDFRRARLRRLHRKIAVIDGRVAFVGGINIIDDMHTPGHTPPRYDYAVRIEGTLVAEIRAEADRLWRLVALSNFREWWEAVPPPVKPAAAGFQRAAFLVRDNFRHRSDIEDAYLAAIENANEEIVLASAYFFPGVAFRRALIAAARRGVRVVVLLQKRVEYVLLHYASRALYGQLLDGGVQLYEYGTSFLHAKVAVVDGRWATVGSSNIDPLSLLLSREANIVVEDRRFAQELRERLIEHIEAGAVPVSRPRWRKKPLGMRVRIWIAYGVARLLMGWFGYAEKHFRDV
jgi:cardiolipin synthase A/B